MLSSTKIGMVLFAVGAVAANGTASAYTIETHFTMKCHEKLTAQALRTARTALGMAAAPRPSAMAASPAVTTRLLMSVAPERPAARVAHETMKWRSVAPQTNPNGPTSASP